MNEEQLKAIHAFVLKRMKHVTGRIDLARTSGVIGIPEFNQAIGAKFAFIEMRKLLEESFPDVDWNG